MENNKYEEEEKEVTLTDIKKNRDYYFTNSVKRLDSVLIHSICEITTGNYDRK